MLATLVFVILNLINCCCGEPVSSNVMDIDQVFDVALYESTILIGKNKTSFPIFVSLSENKRIVISSNFSEAPVDYFSITITIMFATNFSIKITGTMSEWYFDTKLNCSNQYIQRNNSSYIQCLSTSNNTIKASLNESRLLVNGKFFFWESFNKIQLEFEGKTDLNMSNLKVFGWPNLSEKCNCFHPGVKDISVPCDSNSKCICKEGFNYPQCTFSLNSSLPVFPNYGPFDNALLGLPNSAALSNVSVFIGPYDCITTDVAWTSSNFKTCIATMDYKVIDLNLPIKLCWEMQCVILDGVVFTPKVAPENISFDRNKTIRSGGLQVNVYGKNLASLPNPILHIIACPERNSIKNCIYSSSRTLNNSLKKVCKSDDNRNKLICYTPRLYESKSEVNIDYKYYYFSLYSNKFALDRTIKIYEDPNIPVMVPKTQYYEKDKYYPIRNILTDCCLQRDFLVKVGGEDANDIYMNGNFISFRAPYLRPNKSPRDLSQASYVEVILGENVTTVGYIQYDPPINYAAIGAGVGSFVGVALIILIGLIIYWKKRKRPESGGVTRRRRTLLDKLNEPLKSRVVRCLVSEDHLEIQKLIGKGNFGQVHKGVYKGKEVAIKTLSNSETSFDSKTKFLEEAVRMMDFNHPNVLTLIAITIEKDVPKVILPFMINGDLRSFLIKYQEVVTSTTLLQMVRHVVSGMEYLASMCFVHRDLAARNCVVDGDLSVRVADFGLARDIYNKLYYGVKHSDIPLPVHWMAIECLDGKLEFSEKTDVWSFGILMWEVYTKGDFPYFNMGYQKIKTFLRSEKRLPKPHFATDALYEIMLRCWTRDSSIRPTFQKLKICLEDPFLENETIELGENKDTNSIRSMHPSSYPDFGYLTPSSLDGDNVC